MSIATGDLTRAFARPRSGLGPQRLLAGPKLGSGESWDEHCARLDGPISDRLRRVPPDRLIEAVRRSGLRGRGGGGFPAGDKLLAARRHGSGAVVVGNGSETEPAAAKDEVLLRLRPHLVLDGLEVAARALGARGAFLVAPSPAAWDSVTEALAERADRHVPVQLIEGPRNFVGGEETAVIRWIEGGPALPRFQPPRVVDRGWRGLPTVVQNVETLAHLGLIARLGPEWFAAVGTEAEPGTMLITLSGAVERPGVYEVAIGLELTKLLGAAGPDPKAVALLVGGYFGSWLRAPQIPGARLSRAGLAPLAASPGAGVMHLLPPGSCGLRESHRVVDWLAQQGARQCGPCAHGLPALAEAMGRLAGHRGQASEAGAQLRRWSDQIEGRGACRHPDGAVNLVRSTLAAFGDEIELHERGGCSGTRLSNLPLPPRELSPA